MAKKRQSPDRNRRFLRGAQVADVQKMAAVKQRRRLRQKASSRKIKERLIGFAKSAVGAIALTLLVVFMASRLYIADVDISDESYLQVVEDYFDSNDLQRFKLLLDESALIEAVKQSDSNIDNVALESSMLSNILSVKVSKRSPSYIFADFRRGRAFWLDSKGVIFKEVDSSQFGDFPQIRDVSGIEINLGESIVAQSTLQDIQQVIDALPSLALSFDAIKLDAEPQNFTVELENKKYDLIFTTARSIENQISDAKEFLDSEQGSQVKEYADFRVADKVFYK